MAATQCIKKAFRNGQDSQQKFNLNIRMGKKSDLGDAECGRQLGLLGVVQKGENIQ